MTRPIARGAIVHGRSHDVLTRGGVFASTSDLYAAATSVPGVADALVVEMPVGIPGRSVITLFVELEPDWILNDALERGVRAAIAGVLAPSHVPDVILAAPAIPLTVSGERMELPVRRILRGSSPAAVSAGAADPSALEWFAHARDRDHRTFGAPAPSPQRIGA